MLTRSVTLSKDLWLTLARLASNKNLLSHTVTALVKLSIRAYKNDDHRGQMRANEQTNEEQTA